MQTVGNFGTPAELAEFPNFVGWKLTRRGDKDAKIPYNVVTGQRASTTNEADWHGLATVERAAASSAYTGVGFVFSKQDPFVGVDIDHCVNESTLEVLPWAWRIVQALNSYTEYSPSKRGLHVFVKADPWEGVNQVNCIPGAKVEMYHWGRFFTLTGDHVPGTPTEIHDRHKEFEQVYKELSGDSRAVEAAKKLENGQKFSKLWSGDWSDDYGSQSEADLALCNYLMYAAAGDLERVDRLFRYSGLFRDKWDEHRGAQTYGQRTLEAALKTYMQRQQSIASASDPHYTEMGNAQRLILNYGDELLFCSEMGRWLHWEKTHWVPDSNLVAIRLLQQTLKEMFEEALNDPDRTRRQDVVDHVIKSENYQRIKGSEMLARSMCMVRQQQLDVNPMLLNVANGTLNLETGELWPHERGNYITKVASVEYVPDAECPRWQAFLWRVLDGDQSLLGFVQKAVGYTLSGSTREQVLFFLYGLGANGKTTFLETLREVLGDYATQADSNTFMTRRDEGPRNDIARLVGRRMVVSTEVEEGRRMGEVVVKQLTGGDMVVARFLHQEFFEYRPNFKIWIAGNHKPSIMGTDEGIWRRLRLIPFNVTIPEEERDPELGSKLRGELPGILAWAVRGFQMWQDEGLKMPDSVRDATRDYRTEMDVILSFLDSNVEYGPDNKVKVGELYSSYEQWCVDSHERVTPKRQFEQKLKERGYETKAGSGNVKYWHGFRLSLEGETSAMVAQVNKAASMSFDDLYEKDV